MKFPATSNRHPTGSPHPGKLLLAATILALGYATPAQTALGGPAGTLPNIGQTVTAPSHQLAQQPQGVKLQTVLTPQNVTITEFSRGGTVFAIRWDGPIIPDQSQLLGNYFPKYAAAMQARNPRIRNAPVQIRSNALVVHVQGHMRSFSGSAYDPTLVPVGLSVSVLGVDP
ncbi:MAG: DUF2844 domain-containing protein [Betaproteobacteria bacterium]|nr:DUF2844 domain-containing protein [Betaproteobacteria bacterium]